MEQSKTQPNIISTNPNDRQFTLDEYRKIVLDASVIQQKDIALKQTSEKLEHIIEAEKTRLSQQDAQQEAEHKITDGKLTIEDLYIVAKELKISRKYIDKILSNYGPTSEEVKKDLEESNAEYSTNAIRCIYIKRCQRLGDEMHKIALDYKEKIEEKLTEELPLNNFRLSIFKNEARVFRGGELKDLSMQMPQILGDSIITQLCIGQVEKGKENCYPMDKYFASIFFDSRPSVYFLENLEYKELDVSSMESMYRDTGRCKNLFFQQTIRLHNPLFLRVVNPILLELKEKYKHQRADTNGNKDKGYKIISEFMLE